MWHHQQNDIAWHASKLQIRLKFRLRREAEAKKQSPETPLPQAQIEQLASAAFMETAHNLI